MKNILLTIFMITVIAIILYGLYTATLPIAGFRGGGGGEAIGGRTGGSAYSGAAAELLPEDI